MSERDRKRKIGTLLIAAVLLVAYLGGHGLLLLLGLSSTAGEKLAWDSTQFDDYGEGGSRKAELYVNYSRLYLLHRDVAIREDVKWLFGGEIRLLDGSEDRARTFRFFYFNVSNGYWSHPYYFEYEGNGDSNRFDVVFTHSTRFYRPGEYVLRVDDLLIDSNTTFRGTSRILVYDETFRMIEDFQNKASGYFEILLALLISLIIITAWTQFGVVVSWVDLKWEWRAFWKSPYADVLLFFLLLHGFDLLTTLVGLSHGAWELNDFFRIDMYGSILASFLIIGGFGFFLFYFHDPMPKSRRTLPFDPAFLVYLIGFGIVAGIAKIAVVASNLDVLMTLAGEDVHLITLAAIIVSTVLFVVWRTLRRVLQKRKKVVRK